MNNKKKVQTDSQPRTMKIEHGEAAGTYTVHLAASMFPLLTGVPFEELKVSIKSNGQQDPVVVQDKTILDGRNRLRIMNELGQAPKVIHFSELQTDLPPSEWIIAKNLQRRHLTDDQRLAVAARYQAWLTQDQTRRSAPAVCRSMCAIADANEIEAGSSLLTEKTNSSEFPPKSAENANKRKRGRPHGMRNKAEQLASLTKQSRYRTEKMLKMEAQYPELTEAIRNGDISFKEAVSQAKNLLPQKEQADHSEGMEPYEVAFRKAEQWLARMASKLPEGEERLDYWNMVSLLSIREAQEAEEIRKKLSKGCPS